MPAFRDDTDIVLLKKIVLASGCPGVDCCGFQTEQMLLYLWARCVCGDDCAGPNPNPQPPLPESNLWLLEGGGHYQLEDGSGNYQLE